MRSLIWLTWTICRGEAMSQQSVRMSPTHSLLLIYLFIQTKLIFQLPKVYKLENILLCSVSCQVPNSIIIPCWWSCVCLCVRGGGVGWGGEIRLNVLFHWWRNGLIFSLSYNWQGPEHGWLLFLIRSAELPLRANLYLWNCRSNVCLVGNKTQCAWHEY